MTQINQSFIWICLLSLFASFTQAQNVDKLAKKANKQLEKENYKRAMNLYDRLLAKAPENATYYARASDAYLSRVDNIEEDTAQMRKLLLTSNELAKKAVNIDDQNALGHTNFGLTGLWLAMGFATDTTKIVKYYGNAIEAVGNLQLIDADSPDSYMLRGTWHLTYVKTPVAFRPVLNMKYNLPDGGKAEDAVRCFQYAYENYEEKEDKIGALYSLAEAQFENGDLKKAKQNAQRVVDEADPDQQESLIENSKKLMEKIKEEEESWW